jgi:hypothetical protein
MKMGKLRIIAVTAGLTVAGCGEGGNQTVGGVSPAEAAQLNDAAEMLDASADGLAAPEDAAIDSGSNSGDVVGNSD